MTGAPAASFQLVAGNAALDLVNTLDSRFDERGPQDLLGSYDDVLRLVTQSGLLSDVQARQLKRLAATEAERTQVLEQVKRLREALATVAYALLDGRKVPDQELVSLELFIQQASAQRQFRADPDHVFWKWRTVTQNVAVPLWLITQEAADLLLSKRITLLRACAVETCRWLFLDTSKNHTRRWCDMKVCGNRMKARRFQQRSAGRW